MLVAPLDEGANGGGCGIENGDLMVVDDLPETGKVGPVGSALIHHHGGAVLQWAIDNIRVPGDPADVSRAPVDVLVFQVEDVLRGDVSLHGIPAGGVNQSLGFAGGAGGIQNIQRIFRVHVLGGAIGSGGGHQVVPPVVAAVNHLHGRAGAAKDDHMLDGVARVHGFIDGALELNLVAAAVARVLREDCDAAGVVDAVGDGVGGKAAEDNRVDGADAGAGQQGNGQLRGHAHVDGYAVALADAQRLESVSEALHLGI